MGGISRVELVTSEKIPSQTAKQRLIGDDSVYKFRPLKARTDPTYSTRFAQTPQTGRERDLFGIPPLPFRF
jgi:hypothetical protein